MKNIKKFLKNGYVNEFIKFLKNMGIYDKYLRNHNNRDIYNAHLIDLIEHKRY